jgi:hypothetical protein
MSDVAGNFFIGPDGEALENDYVVPVDSVHAIKTPILHQISPLLNCNVPINESAGDSKEIFQKGHVLHFKMKREVSHHDFFKQPETSENIRKVLGVRN